MTCYRLACPGCGNCLTVADLEPTDRHDAVAWKRYAQSIEARLSRVQALLDQERFEPWVAAVLREAIR